MDVHFKSFQQFIFLYFTIKAPINPFRFQIFIILNDAILFEINDMLVLINDTIFCEINDTILCEISDIFQLNGITYLMLIKIFYITTIN